MLNFQTAEAQLKEYYTDDRVRNMAYRDGGALFSFLQKKEKSFGEIMPVVVRLGDPQNRAARFRNGQRSVGPSVTTATESRRFQITRVKNYAFGFLDAETVEAMSADPGTFLIQATDEINGVIASITRDLALDLYRDANGVRGRVSAATNAANSVITLTERTDARNFEIGQLLWAAAGADPTAAVRSETADVPAVIAVDIEAGTITVNANVTTYVSAWSAAAGGDYLFVAGDAPNGAAARKIAGLSSWVPTTTPAATPFFGVNRTSHPTRLAGVRTPGTGSTVEEALMDAVVDISNEGGRPDYAFMNPHHLKQLLKELGTSVVRNNVTAPGAKVGFKSVEVVVPSGTGSGTIQVFGDHNCPIGRAYVMTMKDWELRSIGGAPKLLGPGHDGLRMLRQANDDSYEIRYGYYAQLVCRAPGHSGVVTLAV
jgi:hypothetical protein